MIFWLTPENLTAFRMALSEERYKDYVSQLSLTNLHTEAVLVFLANNQDLLIATEEDMCVSMTDAVTALVNYKICSDDASAKTLGRYFISRITEQGLNIDLNAFINVTAEINNMTAENAAAPVNGRLFIPDSVITVDSGIYSDNHEITQLTFGKLCTIVGAHSFDGCKELADIQFNNRVAILDSCAFRDTAVGSLILPESTRRICESAFENNKELTSVLFNEGLHTISEAAFRGCARLAEVKLPYTLERLGAQVFALNTVLQNVELASVMYIGSRCFAMCRTLEELHIPASVYELGDHFAEGCSSLKYIYLPRNIPVVHEKAFAGIPKTCTLRIEGENGDAPILIHVIKHKLNYEVI